MEKSKTHKVTTNWHPKTNSVNNFSFQLKLDKKLCNRVVFTANERFPLTARDNILVNLLMTAQLYSKFRSTIKAKYEYGRNMKIYNIQFCCHIFFMSRFNEKHEIDFDSDGYDEGEKVGIKEEAKEPLEMII
jgi:hypothetical protein